MNKLKTFFTKHQTAIILTGLGIGAAACTFILINAIKHVNDVNYTLADFKDEATFEDFKAAMALAKEYDAEVTFNIK